MVDSVILCFEAHQPRRIGRNRFWDKEANFWSEQDRVILNRVSEKCYLKTNTVLQNMDKLKGGFSISGVLLEQLEELGKWDVLESFKKLFDSDRFELIGETQYHSLAALVDSSEFYEQMGMHRQTLNRLFGKTPTCFVNTELIFHRSLVQKIRNFGYTAIFAEGCPGLLYRRSPNHLYTVDDVKVFVRNNELSDDIGFRFSNPSWSQYPLTAEKYAEWVSKCEGEFVTVYIDYETFGEHHSESTGIFGFLAHLGDELTKRGVQLLTPTEALHKFGAAASLEAKEYTSWADTEKDLSAWLGNSMQREAFEEVYRLEKGIKDYGYPDLLWQWRILTESDHLYYCSTKSLSSGDVHMYFNPYKSPYMAFINLINASRILASRINLEHSYTRQRSKKLIEK
jgi:alpha-amylase